MRIGRGGLLALAVLLLAPLAASTPAIVASSRTPVHPRRTLQQPPPNPNCPNPQWNVGWWFLGDSNYPDNTTVAPGTSFEKGWWLQNCGTQDWTVARAVRVPNVQPGRIELPGAPNEITLPHATSGAVFEVRAWMAAPTAAGHYRATYQVEANTITLDNYFWVDIIVGTGGTFTLSVGISGSGSVASSPPGISCGAVCSHAFAAGTPVTLTASPGTGYHFASWGGDTDCGDGVVEMNADRSCTATFEPNTGTSYSLTVSKTGSGSGTVTSSPPGISCGGDCSEVYPSGTFVVLNAAPDPGSSFEGWSGDCSSGGTVVMYADRSCTASFGTGGAGAALQLSASPSEVTVNGDGWPEKNPVSVTVTASCSGSCSGHLVLNVGISTTGVPSARFYRYETSQTSGCTLTDDDLSGRFSASAVFLDCPLSFPTGGSASYQMKLWMQPSAGGVMPVQATWQGLQEVAPVTVEAARIHPVVFIHGILGSMPPQPELVGSRDRARNIFDPFLGHYWPELDTLLKMGYEWDRSLFGVAYDWRAPNEDSAGFLAGALAEVISRSRPPDVPYVSGERKADLLVHSMGGLVARSYIQGSQWAGNVRKVIFVASPHKGFPFDYATWEGMTWSQYVYAAPPPLVGGITFTEITNRVLWPTLVAKRYQPSLLEQLACIALSAVELSPALNNYDGAIIYGPDPPHIIICPRDLVEGWAKNGDSSRGIGSLKQMLPTEDSPTYLFGPQFPFGPSVPYPWGHEVNTFLEGLNANIGTLVTRIGPDNIYVLAGEGAFTPGTYGVIPPPLLSNMWAHGQPVVVGGTPGDDLIPKSSSTLAFSGLVSTLPAGNEQVLNAAPLDGARHSPLMHHDQVQRKWVPKFLAGVDELPFKTDYVVPSLIPDQALEVLAVTTACPVNLMITDPGGKKLGYDPDTKTVVNDFGSSATYLSPGAEPQLLWIGNPTTGTYTVHITGWQNVGVEPGYVVRADRVGVGGTVGPIIAVARATAPEQEDTFTFDLVANQPPVADAGPDQTVAAGPDCTASVTLDGSGSSDPDGDTLYYTWESDVGTFQGVAPTLSLPLGRHEVRLSVHDGKGQVSRRSVVITVEDRTPPTITVPDRVTAEQTSLAGTPVKLPDPVVKDNCSPPSVTNDAPATFPLGSTLVTWTATDAAGNVGTATTTVTVVDTTPPVLTNIPAPVTVEQASAAGTRVVLGLPTARDICDAAPVVTSDAPAIFPLGRTTVTFTAVDASGNVARAHTTVTVVDTRPPVIRKLVANPSSLWPPNHKMVPVAVTPTVVDVCDARPRCRITVVGSSDPVTGKGDNTSPDWIVTGDLTVDLRAERAGGGSGRLYTLTVRCTDASGNAAAGTVSVSVPHDQGGGR